MNSIIMVIFFALIVTFSVSANEILSEKCDNEVVVTPVRHEGLNTTETYSQKKRAEFKY